MLIIVEVLALIIALIRGECLKLPAQTMTTPATYDGLKPWVIVVK